MGDVSDARCNVANMQVITAVYLNCRPDLRDEWLTGIEVDDVAESQARQTFYRAPPTLTDTIYAGARAGSSAPSQILYVYCAAVALLHASNSPAQTTASGMVPLRLINQVPSIAGRAVSHSTWTVSIPDPNSQASYGLWARRIASMRTCSRRYAPRRLIRPSSCLT